MLISLNIIIYYASFNKIFFCDRLNLLTYHVLQSKVTDIYVIYSTIHSVHPFLVTGFILTLIMLSFCMCFLYRS